jgi:hypothetical protein
MRQVYKKLQEPQIILKLPDIFNAANEYVVTNLSVQEMAQLAAFAKDLTPTSIESGMAPGKVATINGGSYWLPDLEGSAVVFNRLAGMPINSWPPPVSQPSNRDVAYASSLNSTSSVSSTTLTGPISVGIRYSKGSEQAAKSLEIIAAHMGYKVTGRIKADPADCQHSSIIANTVRPDQESMRKLRSEIPCLSSWPTVINLDSTSPCDITLVVNPQCYIETAEIPQTPVQKANK